MPVLDLPLEKLKIYKGSSPLPKDFDEYWNKALDELDDCGIDYEIEPAEFTAPGIFCGYLYFSGAGGARVCCKFLRPERIVNKIPGMILFHGYAQNSGGWMNKLAYAYSDHAVLALDVRGQTGCSEDNLRTGGNTFRGHIIRGLSDGDPEKLFFRNVFLDTVQAARILMSMDFVDEMRIGALGTSQGGGLAIACAALEPRIKMNATAYPFLSDYKRTWHMDHFTGAYDELAYYVRSMDPRHQNIDRMFEMLGYIDVSNLAPRIKGETYMLLTLQDNECLPSTQFAVYNKITAPKSCEIYPNHGHEFLPYADELFFNYFKRL